MLEWHDQGGFGRPDYTLGGGMDKLGEEKKLKLRAAMWASGMSIGEIAERCGVSYSAIENYARKHRDMFPKRTKPSKATLVNQMWAMYGDGMPVWKIAKTLGRPVREVEEWLAEE